MVYSWCHAIPKTAERPVFGNLGAILAFRVGCLDAERLEKEFAPFFDREELAKQRNFELVYKKLVHGEAEDPSFAYTLPPAELQGDEASPEMIIRRSRERYGRERKKVEERIGKWFES